MKWPCFSWWEPAAFPLILLGALSGCAAPNATVLPEPHQDQAMVEMLDRIAWGATPSTIRQASALGAQRYLQWQLHPGVEILPSPVQTWINAMTIVRQPAAQIALQFEQRRKSIEAISDDDEKKNAQQAYQYDMNRIAQEAAGRSLVRMLYSPNQLQEQMTWFWMNHFSVFQGKHNLRLLIGDYEENAIRPHALGRFRDLLSACAHHPAMLRYLDNEQNAAGHINENFARELMELHTLGVDGGYSQRDVQELARILTGVGVNIGPSVRVIRRELRGQYIHQGMFEFNPNRHDYGDKQFLGQVVRGRGLAEFDEALDRLSRHPATARFISRKLAVFFVSDNPPDALVERMANRFKFSDGDIAATLQTLFDSPEYRQSLRTKFKDPVHYVVSAIRLAYDDKPILNVAPIMSWLNRLGEPLYGRVTPDGYPLLGSAWSSAGQLAARFEVARAIGSSSANLFKIAGPPPEDRPAFPQVANELYYGALKKMLSPATQAALEQARSPQEWNTLFLSSPEMMMR